MRVGSEEKAHPGHVVMYVDVEGLRRNIRDLLDFRNELDQVESYLQTASVVFYDVGRNIYDVGKSEVIL